MEQRQLRALRGKGTNREVFIINVPKKLATFFKDSNGAGVYFNIDKSGNQIIMSSGCKIELTKEVIENYQYEDCKIN